MCVCVCVCVGVCVCVFGRVGGMPFSFQILKCSPRFERRTCMLNVLGVVNWSHIKDLLSVHVMDRLYNKCLAFVVWSSLTLGSHTVSIPLA